MRNKASCPLSDAIAKGAANGLRLRMTAPLTPSCFPDDLVPRKSVRVDQTLATDLVFLGKELSKNAFFETRIGNGSWSAINVLSAYTNAFHAMLLETGDRRYLPGPEWMPSCSPRFLGDALICNAQRAAGADTQRARPFCQAIRGSCC